MYYIAGVVSHFLDKFLPYRFNSLSDAVEFLTSRGYIYDEQWCEWTIFDSVSNTTEIFRIFKED